MACLPSVPDLTLNKPKFFAKCLVFNTRQRVVQNVQMLASLPSVQYLTLDKHAFFAECQIPGTRQTCHLCRVSNTRHSAKTGPERINVGFFAECHSVDTRQRSYFRPRMHRNLPRVRFAEWFYPGTRQKASLPSVTLGKATIYSLFLLFGHV